MIDLRSPDEVTPRKGSPQARRVRTLYVLRHAKSSWKDPADHDRPLAPRGTRAVALLATHLRRTQQPDLVISSSARRAQDTLAGIVGSLGEGVRVLVEEDLYGAGASVLLTRLRAVDAKALSVMVIGHNPGLQDLTVALAGDGDDNAMLTVQRKFPTGALATLSFRGTAWSALGPGAAYLESVVLPRELQERTDSRS